MFHEGPAKLPMYSVWGTFRPQCYTIYRQKEKK
jgi:hypothetical protein